MSTETELDETLVSQFVTMMTSNAVSASDVMARMTAQPREGLAACSRVQDKLNEIRSILLRASQDFPPIDPADVGKTFLRYEGSRRG